MASRRAKYLVITPAGKFLTSTLAEAKAVERAGGVPAKRKRNPAGGHLDFDAEFWAGEVMDDLARAIRQNRPEWDWDPLSGKFYSEGPQLEVQLAANDDGSVSIYVSADELMHDTAPLQSKADVRKARTEAVKWANSYFKRGNPAKRRKNPWPEHKAAALLVRMHADKAATFAGKVAWVRKHMPGISDPQAFVAQLVRAGGEPIRKRGKSRPTKGARRGKV